MQKRIEIKLNDLLKKHYDYWVHIRWDHKCCYICSLPKDRYGYFCEDCYKVYKPILDKMIEKEDKKRDMLHKLAGDCNGN